LKKAIHRSLVLAALVELVRLGEVLRGGRGDTVLMAYASAASAVERRHAFAQPESDEGSRVGGLWRVVVSCFWDTSNFR
jgi:hypothetical protein